MSAEKHRWLFMIEDTDFGEVYLDSKGKTKHAEKFFIGTDAEAEKESERRANLWEADPKHGIVMNVTREGHGVIA